MLQLQIVLLLFSLIALPDAIIISSSENLFLKKQTKKMQVKFEFPDSVQLIVFKWLKK